MLYKRCRCDDRDHCRHAWWYEFDAFTRRHRKSTKTTNRRTAERIEAKAYTDALETKSGIAKPKPIKLSALKTLYTDHTSVHNATAYKDAAVIDRLIEEVGDKDIDQVTPFDVERWKLARVRDVEKSTVNREFNIVRGFFSYAVLKKFIVESPAWSTRKGKRPGVDAFKVDDQRIRVFSDDELRTLMALDDEFVVTICTLTIETLGRISENLSLRREHIGPSWVERRLKGGKVVRVSITNRTRTALLARCHASGFVFGEGATGHPPTQQTASLRVVRAFEAAGLTDASHHTARHTGVTIMLEKGINPRTIQTLAGWSSLRMLERYGHSRDAEMRRAVTSIAEHLDTLGSTTPQVGPEEVTIAQ